MKLILQMSIAICTCMIVSWTPYSIVSMWETYGDSSTLPVQLEAFSAIMAKSSTAFSPLIHLLYTKKFSHWFKKFLFCICVHNPPVPTTILVLLAAEEGLTLRAMNDVHDRSRGLTTSDRRIILQSRSSSLGVRERAPPSFLRYIDQVVNEPIRAQCNASFSYHSKRKSAVILYQ
jgi:hypothetical protein